jgi:hypothetical protein
MGVNKKHDEFHTLDMNVGWETPPGYPKGIEQKILSGALDETSKRGTRTRLLRFAPGVFTTMPFVHDYWEEVLLVSGDLTVGNDAQGNGGKSFSPNTPMPSARQAPIMGRSSRTAAACLWKSTTSIPFEQRRRSLPTASRRPALRLHGFLELITYDLARAGARDLGDQLHRMGHFVGRELCAAVGDQRLIFDRLARPRHHK